MVDNLCQACSVWGMSFSLTPTSPKPKSLNGEVWVWDIKFEEWYDEREDYADLEGYDAALKGY